MSHPAWERVAGSGAAAGTRRRGYPGPGGGGGGRETPAVVGGNGGSAGAGAPGAALPPVPLAPSFHSAHWRKAGAGLARSPLSGWLSHPSIKGRLGRRRTCASDWPWPERRWARRAGRSSSHWSPPSPAACQSNESRRAARRAAAGRGAVCHGARGVTSCPGPAASA